MLVILLNLLKSYGGYILLAAAAGGWFLYHDHQEIDKGEARIVAAQKAADVKEGLHVAQVEKDAKATIDGLRAQLTESLLTPITPPHVVVRMCSTSPSVSTVAANDDRGAGPGSDGAAGSGGAVGGNDQDIAGPTEQILKDDRALIVYLQGYVVTCQNAGLCGKTPNPVR
jgi:hypothetical protein